jgi:hypothetical protein
MGAGIDYSMGRSNIDVITGIRYGVISQHEVLQAWADSSEPYYNRSEEGEDNEDDFAEPSGYVYEEDGYIAECGDDGDIFILKSPYYTKCKFCSPCAPGAGYLMSPDESGIKAYCFGHDWFDRSKPCEKCCGTGNIGLETYQECPDCKGKGEIDLGAPYPVYDAKTDLLVEGGS